MSSPIVLIRGKPHVGVRLGEPDVLWRYLDAAKFIDFLENQSLFFCRGDQFEDKFEGSFTHSLRYAIRQSYQVNNIPFSYEEFRERMRQRVFVNCWHRSRDDSMAMWNLYGRSGCSVAITTTISRLRRAIEEQHHPYRFFIERVEYVKHWRNPEMNVNPYSRVFAYKVKAYEYEKEVRVFLDRSIDEFDVVIPEIGMPIKVRPKTLLRSIVLPPEVPPWFESLVRQLKEKYQIEAPVHRSKLATEPL